MHQSHLPPSPASPASLPPGPSQRNSPVGSNRISLTISRTNAYLRENECDAPLVWFPAWVSFFFLFSFQPPPRLPAHLLHSKVGTARQEVGDSLQRGTEEENRARTHQSPSPLALHAIPARPSSTTHTPRSPLLLSSSGVTKGARCLVPENVPTYQKAPGLHVEAAQRRKRSR